MQAQSHLRPTVRRRRLGAELKRLREAAGVRMDDAAERIGCDKGKISRIENGRLGVRKLEMEALLDLYQAEGTRLRAALTALAREGRRKGWWQRYGDILGPEFQERLSIEADAVRILEYQNTLVPGLLQTPEYATELIRRRETAAARPERESYVAVRMARQGIFGGGSAPDYVCVLDEAALRREIGGPSVMAAQLRKLIEVSGPPELTIQVIPFAQGWHAGVEGAFSICSYPDPMDLDVVNVDYLGASLYLEEKGAVEAHQAAFDQLRASALSPQRSMELISRTAQGFDDRRRQPR
ncbi:helix-turn-helix transcriptional regulator [Streptomyces sp. XD-27]|uniref:helix-turn-helix domain-containing protein n=1 Tax=Streptomyces sp. XD-27 TaxID=3062779 RepID=UPI0026F46CC7|nr:helix-turn-helix transcriptional regulator [Streptomyces sp. XD-27]WKX73110.1 helix-turn-helix transcriptional regulator [Streptomyces sp. XD-27]